MRKSTAPSDKNPVPLRGNERCKTCGAKNKMYRIWDGSAICVDRNKCMDKLRYLHGKTHGEALHVIVKQLGVFENCAKKGEDIPIEPLLLFDLPTPAPVEKNTDD